MVICLERGADLHMAQRMPLSLASVISRLVLPFWYWLTRVVPDKGPLNGCICMYWMLKVVDWFAVIDETVIDHRNRIIYLSCIFLSYVIIFIGLESVVVLPSLGLILLVLLSCHFVLNDIQSCAFYRSSVSIMPLSFVHDFQLIDELSQRLEYLCAQLILYIY